MADRVHESGWFGPVSLGLALLSWLTPIGGEVVAIAAIGCGAASIRREYRTDWTAVTGICVAVAQLFLALILFAMDVSGV